MADEYGRIASGVKRRNYVSRYREEMAAETRRRIVAAAIELFSERGCAATSIEDIAASAGVSGPTVFAAVGNKRELMKQARDVALVGDDKPVPMPQRPWVAALRAEAAPDAALRIYAAAMRGIFHRAARLELALAAAEADPELAGLAETAREQRAFGCRLIAKELASKSKLRARAHKGECSRRPVRHGEPRGVPVARPLPRMAGVSLRALAGADSHGAVVPRRLTPSDVVAAARAPTR